MCKFLKLLISIILILHFHGSVFLKPVSDETDNAEEKAAISNKKLSKKLISREELHSDDDSECSQLWDTNILFKGKEKNQKVKSKDKIRTKRFQLITKKLNSKLNPPKNKIESFEVEMRSKKRSPETIKLQCFKNEGQVQCRSNNSEYTFNFGNENVDEELIKSTIQSVISHSTVQKKEVSPVNEDKNSKNAVSGQAGKNSVFGQNGKKGDLPAWCTTQGTICPTEVETTTEDCGTVIETTECVITTTECPTVPDGTIKSVASHSSGNISSDSNATCMVLECFPEVSEDNLSNEKPVVYTCKWKERPQ